MLFHILLLFFYKNKIELVIYKKKKIGLAHPSQCGHVSEETEKLVFLVNKMLGSFILFFNFFNFYFLSGYS